MGFLYENTSDDRFQQMCQSLLLDEFPALQCFPVGQQDGGRDGFDALTKTVLQVKFRKNDEPESADWMLEALEGELPKIQRLIARGAETYVMVTNARGTGHLNGGRIDRVQAWFDENVSIPAFCLWRDDIDRRLERAPLPLRLRYPELLSLQDGIDIAALMGPDGTRRNDAVRSFVASQFLVDQTVKFKQVDLSNDLLDLFVDVPVGFPAGLKPLKTQRDPAATYFDALGALRDPYNANGLGMLDVVIPDSSGNYRRFSMGTAAFLFSSEAQKHLPFIVLEGAPGQGKSTLAQYACQVHRARFLGKTDLLDRIPESHRQSGFRIPVKVDLRDFDSFLRGESPFATTQTSSLSRTLDVFLAELISNRAGGVEFSAYDLLAFLKGAPVLLFLDGLDEVADLDARQKLIEAIVDAVGRWGEFECDLQVVITSRPSVFGRPLRLQKHGFTTVMLSDIDEGRIEEYADKWTEARQLEEPERAAVKKILGEKLKFSHIRDLTRNLMQLTILLSLIHQVGHSLPDQRTDLYRRYVDLFFTREADKSERVLAHRHVLQEFVQFLAWTLQSQAEASRTAGSISESDLQSLAAEYMRRERRPESIADNLFGGGLERIFVLVERIEGQYEFEVQPLREYYCAQYLYATAPVGTQYDSAVTGDRSERFKALASRPFWLNVCRFYAGSCTRGETGTLVFSLKEMIQSSDTGLALHARQVGLSLVQDWVFNNVKYQQEDLLRAIFDETGIAMFMYADGPEREASLRFDVECGRDVVVDIAFDRLMSLPRDLRTTQLCEVLRINDGASLAHRFLSHLDGETGDRRSSILIRMFRAGAAAYLESADVWALITADDPGRNAEFWRVIELVDNAPLVAAGIPEIPSIYIRGVLDGLPAAPRGGPAPLPIMADLMQTGSSFYLMGSLRTRHWIPDDSFTMQEVPGTPQSVLDYIAGVRDLYAKFSHGDLALGDSPDQVSEVIEFGDSMFGRSWASCALAVRTAGIPVKDARIPAPENLFDSEVPLYRRVRGARLRRGGPRWWEEQLNLARTDLDRKLWALVMIVWASWENLNSLATHVNDILAELDDDEFNGLLRDCFLIANLTEAKADRRRLKKLALDAFSSRVAACVAIVTKAPSDSIEASAQLRATQPLVEFLANLRLRERLEHAPAWNIDADVRDWAEAAKELGALPNIRFMSPGFPPPHMSLAMSVEVLTTPYEFPPGWTRTAKFVALQRLKPLALSAVVDEQHWTFI
ncbi:NACHT domain-containing protein [Microbacterium sp. CR_7]|uniref:NACHT domain-containing protein n=1 Tax=Microbacterium sp. CR_7 TaxID=3055792 RepID=UPI0035BFB1E0